MTKGSPLYVATGSREDGPLSDVVTTRFSAPSPLPRETQMCLVVLLGPSTENPVEFPDSPIAPRGSSGPPGTPFILLPLHPTRSPMSSQYQDLGLRKWLFDHSDWNKVLERVGVKRVNILPRTHPTVLIIYSKL